MSKAIDNSGGSGGVPIIVKDEKNEIKRYLLGQLGDAEQERLELRLLTDASFSEEFDTVVDELMDQYVGNELPDEEEKLVEQYFLRSTERQHKAEFASELLQRASIERGRGVPGAAAQPEVASKLGILESAILFWRSQSFAFRLATTVTVLVIVIGIGLVLRQGTRRPGTFASITLTLTNTDRASGTKSKSVKLAPGDSGIRIELTLPDQAFQAERYRIELLDEQESPRDLPLLERKAQSLVTSVSDIDPGRYVIRLYEVKRDGSEPRIPGNYQFAVE